MPTFVLKHESSYRFYGASYDDPTIGEVFPDRVDLDGNVVRFTIERDENPDPNNFEELVPTAPARPALALPPVTPASTPVPTTDTVKESD